MTHDDLNPSAPTDSVTDWLVQLKAGDSVAAQKLWQRYVERLTRLAHAKLWERPRRVADEEDVVLTAFHALLDGVEQGRFTRLDDRYDLWQILVMLTERKAIGLLRREQAAKRGGGQVRGESALDVPLALSTVVPGIAQLPGREPTPEFAAEVQEEYARLCGKLGGCTNREVADRLGLSLRAVERKLQVVRRKWRREMEA